MNLPKISTNTIKGFVVSGAILTFSMLCLSVVPALSGPPGPGPGPGPAGGGGPPDPPRDTPGLDPITLSAIAAAGYGSYRLYKSKQEVGGE